MEKLFDFYFDLNNATEINDVSSAVGKFFSEQGKVFIAFFKENQAFPDMNLKFFPLEIDNNNVVFIVFEEIISPLKEVWQMIINYEAEITAVVRRINRCHENLQSIESLNILNNIQKIANSDFDLTKVFHKIIEELKRVIFFERASVVLLNKDETMTVLKVFDEGKTRLGSGLILPLKGSAQEWLIKNNSEHMVADLSKEFKFAEDGILLDEGYLSALRIPMYYNNEIIGSINLNVKKVNAFSKKDIYIMKKVAIVIAFAIMNAFFIKQTEENSLQLENENKHLQILNNILSKFIEFNDFKQYIYFVLKELVVTMNLLGAVYYTYSDGKWVNENEYYIDENLLEKIKIPEKYQENLSGIDVVSFNGTYLLLVSIKDENELRGLLALISTDNDIVKKEKRFLTALARQFSIVTKNIQLYRSVQHAAEHDQLTGLFNKSTFFSYLRKEIGRHRRSQKSLVLLIIDVDDFKKFNDKFGHFAGDEILKNVASIIKNNLRKCDIAGRFGGEEFLVLLPNTDLTDGIELAKRLTFVIEKETMNKITVSIGLASYEDYDEDAVNLVQRADQALYNAKRKGKNQVIVASRR